MLYKASIICSNKNLVIFLNQQPEVEECITQYEICKYTVMMSIQCCPCSPYKPMKCVIMKIYMHEFTHFSKGETDYEI